MKRYNLSEIMKATWNLHKVPLEWVTSLSFGKCLRRAWKSAKEAARVFSGLVRNVQVGGTLAHPVLMDIGMDVLTVTGDTYPARSMMRESNLVQDRGNKAWAGSRETLSSICIRYA